MSAIWPAKEAEFCGWARVFDAHVAEDPQAVGIDPLDSAELHGLYETYAAALAVCNDPSTRTTPAVAHKREVRKPLEKKLRQMVRVVNAQTHLLVGQRIYLGLRPLATGGPSVPKPATRPFVAVDPRGGVRLRDDTQITRRAKPAGYFGAALFTAITEVDGPAPASTDDARFAGIATRATYKLDLSKARAGKKLWVLARWINTRGQTGPTSKAAGTVIAA